MDSDNTKKLKRKRKQNEKEKADAPKNNNHKTDKISQENIVQSNQKKKKRLKLNEVSNDATTDIETSKSVLSSKEVSDENVKTAKNPSKRQLKKEKAVQVAVKKMESRRSHAMQKALNYVSLWKHSRNEWKFEKLKQIWLMDNLLDDNSISDNLFPIVLEYFEGCKGMAREVLLRKGMEIIRKAEAEADEDNKNEIMMSTTYKRARQLLQTLPTDK
ncbi:PREDICTED: uncharacterized protein C7orf50 homolog [Acromyrmex echinatior]|uniref:Uncharacterized protein C7orf50-like protein n=1 Tax=Acromyrmex echinatior TaxID=103372 RepID=F4X5R8_ACREC|nr:PREDICTED: uncharacterized protein C7orf50 homolog [Acromyrmex echinatior]EGI58158.1 Uncharacterized protein C7orf50-like protein [Acromyrmex echinatior]